MKEQLSEAGYRSNLEYFRNLEIKAMEEVRVHMNSQVDLYDKVRKLNYDLPKILKQTGVL